LSVDDGGSGVGTRALFPCVCSAPSLGQARLYLARAAAEGRDSKEFFHAAAQRRSGEDLISLRRGAAAGEIFPKNMTKLRLLLLLLLLPPTIHAQPNAKLAAEVKAEFLHAWNGYKKYAWGHDDLKPLSKTYHDWYPQPLLMTPVDSLDTMILMDM